MNLQISTEELTALAAQTHIELTALKKKLEELQKELYNRMQQNNLSEVSSPFGRFITYTRTSYTLPEDVIELKKAATAAEEMAKKEGRATEEVKTFYKYSPLKKDDDIQ